jgi:hypothetical protein
VRYVLTCLVCLLLSLLAPTPGALATANDASATNEAKLVFVTVAGAPGDGEQALTAALLKRLSPLGIQSASERDTNAYSVEGTVRVAPVKGGRESVRIDWTVFAPDGDTLGGVSQTRVVRKGSLDKKWGPAADAAARAAANEIAKLLPH